MIDYAKYYESLSNNATTETFNAADNDNDNDMFETIGEENNNTQEQMIDTFEENNESGEDFEEDEDIPLVSGIYTNIISF